MSEIYTRPSSGATPQQIAAFKAEFARRRRRRQWLKSLGTPKGVYTVFMTGVMAGLLIALAIFLITKYLV